MIQLKNTVVGSIALPIILALAASGCARHKYVKHQINPVAEKLAAVEKETNEKIATLSAKHESDVSQVNERLSTVDLKLAQGAVALQQAQTTASRALQQSETNTTDIKANSAAINTLTTGVQNALTYQLVDKGDVMFAVNKCTLTDEAKALLDQIAAKALAAPRAIVELAGFTDKSGAATYNLALSIRRAEAVERYLVSKNVPMRAIHIVGFGEATAPSEFEADLSAQGPNPTKAEINKMARRVRIQIFGAGELTPPTVAAGAQQ